MISRDSTGFARRGPRVPCCGIGSEALRSLPSPDRDRDSETWAGKGMADCRRAVEVEYPD